MSCPAACASGPSCPQPVIRPYTRRGLRAREASGPTPRRSATPGRKPSSNTSARSASRSAASLPSALLRSMATERRLRSNGSCGAGSAVLAAWRSIRTTSAPRSASIMPQNGPGPRPPSSSTLMPLSGPTAVTPGSFQLALIKAEGASDDFFHDLVAARKDAGHARLVEHPADAIFLHVSRAAVQLHALVHHAIFELSGQKLRGGRNLRRKSVSVVLQHTLIDEGLQGIELRPQLRHRETCTLESANRAPECPPGFDAFERQIEGRLGAGE